MIFFYLQLRFSQTYELVDILSVCKVKNHWPGSDCNKSVRRTKACMYDIIFIIIIMNYAEKNKSIIWTLILYKSLVGN